MRRFILGFKKNNKGVSLVEILVTIAIIAIIAAPLINTFINAMNVNSKARLIQNGTSAAQNVAEKFKVLSMDTLVAEYGVSPDEDGKYTFTDISVKGADGEDFLIDVELDPTDYMVGASDDKIDVNGVNLPVFSGLHGSESIVLYRQYAGFDDQLQDLFKAQGHDYIADNITDPSVRSNIKKSTNLNIKCNYDSGTAKYKYDVGIEITYSYAGSTSVTVTKSLEKTYTGDQIHSIYLICPIFDIYSTMDAGLDCIYNTDQINVTYSYTGEATKKHNLYLYIAEQEAYNYGAPSVPQCISPYNLKITTDNTVDYINYKIDTNNLKVYTNIGDTNEQNKNSIYDLTYGDYNTGTALYEMNIRVRLKDSTDTVTTFNTTK